MVNGRDTCSTHSVIEGLLNSFGNSEAVEWYCIGSWTILVVKYGRKEMIFIRMADHSFHALFELRKPF